jgi:ADP-heptose:LPS heptosyltransferase
MTTVIKTIVSTLKKIYRYGAPSYILSFGDSLGDNLLLTILARELIIRGHKNVWIKCDHDSLFKNNPDIKLCMPYKELLSTHILNLFKVKVVSPIYTVYDPVTERTSIPEKHFILKMADCLNIKGPITNRPYFFLDDTELLKGKYGKKQIVIVTSTSGAIKPVTNKEWYNDRYQQIVDNLHKEYQFIQLGTKNDVPLTNVTNLCGKTTLRESAAILKNSVLLLSYAGFLMHLARAVDCPAVIVYGGREKPEQTGYSCFQNFYSAVECSPCWLDNICPYDKKCMQMISTDMVEKKVIEQLQSIPEPLIADTLYNN